MHPKWWYKGNLLKFNMDSNRFWEGSVDATSPNNIIPPSYKPETISNIIPVFYMPENLLKVKVYLLYFI